MKIGFVILHYQLENLTKKCVSSIIKHMPDAIIVIVDNCSPNHSGKRLQAFYAQKENIVCLLNSENQVFAKGNNIGYRYLKQHYSCDYICCINNDTIVNDSSFAEKIV